MTEKAELDRVRRIHAALDYGVRTGPAGFAMDGGLGKTISFTAEEVRAWPEMKAKLRQALIGSSPHQCHTLAVWRPGWSGCFGAETHVSDGWENNPPIRANGARGLCLYREMLDDVQPEPALPTGHPAPGSSGLRLNEEQREALGGSHLVTCKCGNRFQPNDGIGGNRCSVCDERTGSYGGNDLGHEAVVAALTVALPTNVEARKRNVAALAAELRKPFEPRFPPEGRSDRVYGGRRW